MFHTVYTVLGWVLTRPGGWLVLVPLAVAWGLALFAVHLSGASPRIRITVRDDWRPRW